MFRSRIFAITVASVALAACASPTVDTTAPTFDEEQYTVDLDNCRGGTVFDVALRGFESAVVWSALGAAEGTVHGALKGNAPEGAAIGAVVGSVVGAVKGAYEPFEQQAEAVRRCLSKKGYVLES